MTYLLDTSGISALMREDASIAAWLASRSADDRITTCAISRGEILFGLERLAAGRRRTELETKAAKVLGAMPCEPIPAVAGDQYARLKAVQQRLGLPLDENDLLDCRHNAGCRRDAGHPGRRLSRGRRVGTG